MQMAQTFEALRKIPQGWSYRTKYHLLGQVPQEFNAGLRLKRWLAYSWLGIDGDSNQADLSAMPSISKVIAFVHDCHDSKQHALWPKEDRPASELVAAIALLSVILLDPPVQTKEDREKLKPIPVVLERYDGMIYSTVREDPERHRAKNAVTRLTHLIGYRGSVCFSLLASLTSAVCNRARCRTEAQGDRPEDGAKVRTD